MSAPGIEDGFGFDSATGGPLSLEIGELGEAGFDLSLTGFDEFELGELFAPFADARRRAI